MIGYGVAQMRRPAILGVLLITLATALAFPGTASSVRLALVAGGFDNLTQVTAPRRGDGAGVLYVVEQEGRIWKLNGGTRTLFLDITNLTNGGGEQGLLGLAFDPQYRTNHMIYVNYTNNNGDTRVARYTANAAHTMVNEGTRRQLLAIDQPAGNHNGGRLVFAPNGRLITAQGDGGGSCDPGGRAQNLRSRHGKLLSINPRALRSGWRIDAYGLRNPWGVSFDRSTNRMYIADVGQGRVEEINTMRPTRLGGTPENFMWDVWEGRSRSGCSNNGLRGRGARVFPVSTYNHSLGCSVTGGYAYRGGVLRSLRGSYVFGDFCSGRIWRIKYANGRLVRGRTLMLDTNLSITSFGEGVGGELYVTNQPGQVYRLVR
jgi:Glucose / Sorbosone dehydrogenase